MFVIYNRTLVLNIFRRLGPIIEAAVSDQLSQMVRFWAWELCSVRKTS